MFDVRNPQAWADPMSRREARSACRSIVLNSSCRGFPRANPSLPIALDPAKAQAPVWRENFSSADTIRCGHSSVGLMPGKKPGCRLIGKKKRRLRIDAVAWGQPPSAVLDPN